MVTHAGIAIFVFGTKVADDGKTLINAAGVRAEFEIARDRGLTLIPIGATGAVAKELWHEVVDELDRYFPKPDVELRSAMESLGDKTLLPERHIETVLRILNKLKTEV